MRLNAPSHLPRTHEGGPAVFLSSEAQLERSVLACLLCEDSFSEAVVQYVQALESHNENRG